MESELFSFDSWSFPNYWNSKLNPSFAQKTLLIKFLFFYFFFFWGKNRIKRVKNLQQSCRGLVRYSCNFQWTKTWFLHWSNCCDCSVVSAWVSVSLKCTNVVFVIPMDGNHFWFIFELLTVCFTMFVLGLMCSVFYLHWMNWMVGKEMEGHSLHCYSWWNMWGAKD